MRDYKKVCRCRDCGKIYDKGIPYICSKCGAEIGKPTPTILQMMGCGEVTLTEKSEKVVAKKGLFGWKVREPQDPEAIQEWHQRRCVTAAPMKITAWVHIAKTIGVEIIPERTEKCHAVKTVKTKGI